MPDTKTTAPEKETECPAKPPAVIHDGDHYILNNKKNTFWEAMQGLGTGWGFSVALGIAIEFANDMLNPARKALGNKRFEKLVTSDSKWRQILDACGMGVGAIIMATKSIRHNQKIDSYAEKLNAGKTEKKPEGSQQGR